MFSLGAATDDTRVPLIKVCIRLLNEFQGALEAHMWIILLLKPYSTTYSTLHVRAP